MSKKQLINEAAKLSGMTKKDMAQALDALMAAMENILISGEEIQLTGFGSFSVKEIAAHTGRNPQTNEAIEILASRRLVFSASKTFKDKLNK